MGAKTSMTKFAAIALLSLILLSACSTSLPRIDVPESSTAITPAVLREKNPVTAVEFRNNTLLMEPEVGFLSKGKFPFSSIFTPAPEKIVSEDLQHFLGTITLAPKSTGPMRRLVVTLQSVRGYMSTDELAAVPFANLLTINNERTLTMELSILFEVEDNGHVTSSYQYSKPVQTRAQMALTGAREAAYKDFIAAYRQQVFPDIQRQFVDRYL